MKTITRHVIVNGTAYPVALYIDADGTYRGRGVPKSVVYDDLVFHALSFWCKGYGDAINGWVATSGNGWYWAGVREGERYGNTSNASRHDPSESQRSTTTTAES